MKVATLAPRDVEHFPDQLEEGVLYISEKFKMAGHRCCCGCGEEVITPLNKAHWRLERRGGLVSLVPSIGNWKFECQSHYWIKNNKVIPSNHMTSAEIGLVIEKDLADRDRFIAEQNKRSQLGAARSRLSPFARLTRWLRDLWR